MAVNRPGKLLNSEEKRKGKKPCNYDLNRMDVEWLNNLNKSRHNKGNLLNLIQSFSPIIKNEFDIF